MIQHSPAQVQYPLHSYQRQVLQDILHVLGAPGNSSSTDSQPRVVVHLPTGAGKTRIACHAVSQLMNRRRSDDALAVWLASSEELCEQAAEELARAWVNLGDRNMAVHRFWGGSSIDLRNLSRGFLVAGLSKLLAASDNDHSLLPALSERAAVIVFDEEVSSKSV